MGTAWMAWALGQEGGWLCRELWALPRGSFCHLEEPPPPPPHVQRGARLSVWCEEGRGPRGGVGSHGANSQKEPERRAEMSGEGRGWQREPPAVGGGEGLAGPGAPRPGASPAVQAGARRQRHSLHAGEWGGRSDRDRCPPVAEGQWAPNPNPKQQLPGALGLWYLRGPGPAPGGGQAGDSRQF